MNAGEQVGADLQPQRKKERSYEAWETMTLDRNSNFVWVGTVNAFNKPVSRIYHFFQKRKPRLVERHAHLASEPFSAPASNSFSEQNLPTASFMDSGALEPGPRLILQGRWRNPSCGAGRVRIGDRPDLTQCPRVPWRTS